MTLKLSTQPEAITSRRLDDGRLMLDNAEWPSTVEITEVLLSSIAPEFLRRESLDLYFWFDNGCAQYRIKRRDSRRGLLVCALVDSERDPLWLETS